jgi:purine-binding chemotaxis protein CheW
LTFCKTIKIKEIWDKTKGEQCMGTMESSETNQYLTFNLDNEVFGLAILKVREVLDFTSITRVPQTPAYMRGVINLRGSVVPVMDLRLKFNMAQTEKTVNTCIIITEVELNGELVVLGALADSVQEVVDLDADQIEPPPHMGTRLRTDFIKGMGKHGDGFIIVLDIDKVFSSEDLAVAQTAGMTSLAAAETSETRDSQQPQQKEIRL